MYFATDDEIHLSIIHSCCDICVVHEGIYACVRAHSML